MKRIGTYIMLILAAMSVKMNGQQSQTYTQFLFNRFLINPGACASNGYTNIGLTFKDQWTGFKGAPTHALLTVQSRINNGEKRSSSKGIFALEQIGLGLSIFNDSRGFIRTTGGSLNYAYHLDMESGQLSFGLGINMQQLYADRSKMITEQPDDPYLASAKLSSFIPDASFGVHFSTEDLYGGLAVSNLLGSYIKFGGKNSSSFRIERQYNLLGGYVFMLDKYWGLSPGALVKFNDRMVFQGDISLQVYYNNQAWGGLSYRTAGGGIPGGVNVMIGASYRQFAFTYAFDYSISDMGRYSFGSHEISLSVTLGQPERFFRHQNRFKFEDSPGSGRLRMRNYKGKGFRWFR